ncbi:MAG: chorismate synthase [Chloroflexi bacterium]|nr:MAG: chorismate synthase [Chloroflexota bacterium]MBL1193456.1 chorismate synthase [Chloroflexota bacterium]NOH10747.1 chorismate synthase [Chloroflexota bacterium]
MKLRLLSAGESHGPALVAILDGMPAGLLLPVEVINKDLARRQKGYGAGPRMKIESDQVRILGGVMEGQTTGAPLALMIENKDHKKWQGKAIPPYQMPRPGHADLVGVVKYGYNDLRQSLERASARETAARVAGGAVCKHFLSQFGIQVGGYVASIGEVEGSFEDVPLSQRVELAEQNEVRCPDEAAAEEMVDRIREIIESKDTLGGVLEVFATGLPVGLGSFSQWDQRLEARLTTAVMGVQAMKGVEFGNAFENTRLPGTQVHDAIRLDGENLVRPTNRAGGTEGGVSNGNPILMRVAMKPIATTLTPQGSVDLVSGEENDTQYERSDFCPVPRAVPILEAVVAFVLADALLEKLGGDSLEELQPRFKSLRQAKLGDLNVDGQEHIWWPE